MPVRLDFDLSDVERFARNLERAPLYGRARSVVAINEVGDALVRDVINQVSQETGMRPEDVRALMVVSRAAVDDLEYSVTIRGLGGGAGGDIEAGGRGLPGRAPLPQRDRGFRQGQLVKVITREDDHVCEICQDIAEHSPYTIEEARSNVHHGGPIGTNNCRCLLVPFISRRTLGVGRRSGDALRDITRSTLRQLADRLAREFAQGFRIMTR